MGKRCVAAFLLVVACCAFGRVSAEETIGPLVLALSHEQVALSQEKEALYGLQVSGTSHRCAVKVTADGRTWEAELYLWPQRHPSKDLWTQSQDVAESTFEREGGFYFLPALVVQPKGSGTKYVHPSPYERLFSYGMFQADAQFDTKELPKLQRAVESAESVDVIGSSEFRAHAGGGESGETLEIPLRIYLGVDGASLADATAQQTRFKSFTARLSFAKPPGFKSYDIRFSRGPGGWEGGVISSVPPPLTQEAPSSVSSLVCVITADESSGRLVRDSARNNHCEWQGTPHWEKSIAVKGNSIGPFSDSNYVTIDSKVLANKHKGSIEFSVYLESLSPKHSAIFISWCEGNGIYGYVDTAASTAPDRGAVSFNLNGETISTKKGVLQVGGWHRVAVTWDGSTRSIYVDGDVQASKESGAFFRRVEGPIHLGNYLALRGYSLNGYLDQIQISGQ